MEAYLALRQQLKQSIRAQMQRDNSGSATHHSAAGDSHSNYGCFFGPSETVLTGNAVKQISNLWSKLKTGQTDFKKTAKPTVTVDAAAMRKRKVVQRFKDSRESQKRDLILKKPIKLIVKLGGSVITKNPTKSTEKGGAKKESKRSSVSVSVSVSKQQQRPEQKKKTKEGEGQKRRPVEKQEKVEDEGNHDAINLIREMFGYDPTTFSDDDAEDLKMEASFADIQKEERISAKIASREDREELRKLEAAESCRKKRKLIISDGEEDEL